MKMNKKGFTLIELLAVIVILAVIALIASPIVLGIIQNSRESSQARSVESFAQAAQQAYAARMAKPGYMGEDITIAGSDTTWYAQVSGEADDANKEPVKYTGSAIKCSKVDYDPTTGYIEATCQVSGSDQQYDYCNAPQGSTCKSGMASTAGSAVKHASA